MDRRGLPGHDEELPLGAGLPRAGLVALVAGYVVLAAAYNVATPVFEAADEHGHYFVAQHIAWRGGLPVQSTAAGDPPAGPWEQEGSQPPLYYWLAAPLVRLTGVQLAAEDLRYNHQNTMGQPALVGNENRFIHPPQREGWPWQGYALAVHLLRALSTLFGLAGVLAAAWLGRLAFPGRGWLALAVGGVMAFNPQFLHVSASVSNDPAVTALATIGLAVFLRWWREPRLVWAAALGVVVALAALAKLSGLALLLFVLAGLALRGRYRRPLGPTVQAAIIVLAIVGALAGWWYLRNQRLYGSWTGLEVMLGDQLRRQVRLDRWLRGLPAELWGVWLSYWGLFGWFTVMLPAWLYGLYSGLAAGGLLGTLAAWRRRASWPAWPVVWLLVAWCGAMMISLLRWLAMTKGGTGRLLFPASGALAMVVVLGWRQLVPRPTDRALAWGLNGSMLVLAGLSLWGVLRAAYAWPPVIPESQVPSSARATSLVFGEGLRLVAVAAPDRVREGQPFALTLYWRVMTPLHRDGYVAVRLDQAVAADRPEEQGWRLVAGRTWLAYLAQGAAPPDLLAAGPQLYVDRRVVVAPELATAVSVQRAERKMPASYRLPVVAELSVHVYDMTARASWPSRDEEGRPIPQGFRVPIVLEPRGGADRRVPCAGPPVARFANGMSLHVPNRNAAAGGAVRRLELHRGAEVALDVAWSAQRPPGEELHAFVHLVPDASPPVAQGDGPPATHGRYPTSYWSANECLPARLRVVTPRDAPAGTRYRMLVGVYRPGEPASRIAAVRADGAAWPEAAVHVADVWLTP